MVVTVALVKKVFEEADVMMKKVFHGLYDSPKFSSIKITNARGYWMKITRYSDSSSFGLRVSRLFENHTNDEDGMHRLKESLIHELVHTLPGAFNHGTYFKEYGRMFHSYYPDYTVERVSRGGSSYTPPVRKRNYKYKITCNTCGAVSRYQRLCDTVRYCSNKYSICYCSRCNGHYFTVEKFA